MLKFQMKGLLKNNGFTLIELIVSLAILSLVVVPISGYFVQATKLNAASHDKLVANQIAQKYIERYKSISSTIVAAASYDNQDLENNGFHVGVDITPQAGYTYIVGDDAIPNIDFSIIHNDGSSIYNKNSITSTKTGDMDPYFIMATGGFNGILNVIINNGDLNTRMQGFIEGNSAPITDLAKARTLAANSRGIETEYMKITVNTNSSLTVNVYNELSKTTNKECMIYIVRQKGKTGKVFVNTMLGKVSFVDKIYDKTATAGLPTVGLYMVKVKVYKGTDRTGTALCTLESLLN